MKKSLVLLAAVCMVMAANARILRVSNVTGSSAPYSTIQAAHDAANAGDTIMVDGSTTSYGTNEINKQLVLVGPGFWLVENGIMQEAAYSATARFNVKAPGTVIMGFRLTDGVNCGLYIYESNCVVTKNYFPSNSDGLALADNKANNTIICKNYFHRGGINGHGNNNIQITNNIFYLTGSSDKAITGGNGIDNSYIAYNTILTNKTSNIVFYRVYNSTIENNIIPNNDVNYGNVNIQNSNEYSNNYVGEFLTSEEFSSINNR